MITIKSEREIELLRIAGNVVYKTHQYLKPFIKEGVRVPFLCAFGAGCFGGKASMVAKCFKELFFN